MPALANSAGLSRSLSPQRYSGRQLSINNPDLAPLEEHLLACSLCVKRAEEAQGRVDAIRAAIIEGGFDLE